MEFRWVMLITLWTLLSGPVFDSAGPAPRSAPSRAATPVADGPANTRHDVVSQRTRSVSEAAPR